jgi:hypothetical protein
MKSGGTKATPSPKTAILRRLPDWCCSLSTERQWEVVLDEAGVPYRVIADEDLTPGLSAIASRRRCAFPMRKRPRSAPWLKRAWAVGARNANCSWKGWDTLTALTGMKEPDTVSLKQDSYAGLRGGQFFSELVPAGYRLSAPSQELVFGTAHAPDIFWSDGRLRPARGDSADAVAMGLHGLYKSGRFVWFGFKETLPDSSGKDQRSALNRYLLAAVRWTICSARKKHRRLSLSLLLGCNPLVRRCAS